MPDASSQWFAVIAGWAVPPAADRASGTGAIAADIFTSAADVLTLGAVKLLVPDDLPPLSVFTGVRLASRDGVRRLQLHLSAPVNGQSMLPAGIFSST